MMLEASVIYPPHSSQVKRFTLSTTPSRLATPTGIGCGRARSPCMAAAGHCNTLSISKVGRRPFDEHVCSSKVRLPDSVIVAEPTPEEICGSGTRTARSLHHHGALDHKRAGRGTAGHAVCRRDWSARLLWLLTRPRRRTADCCTSCRRSRRGRSSACGKASSR